MKTNITCIFSLIALASLGNVRGLFVPGIESHMAYGLGHARAPVYHEFFPLQPTELGNQYKTNSAPLDIKRESEGRRPSRLRVTSQDLMLSLGKEKSKKGTIVQWGKRPTGESSGSSSDGLELTLSPISTLASTHNTFSVDNKSKRLRVDSSLGPPYPPARNEPRLASGDPGSQYKSSGLHQSGRSKLDLNHQFDAVGTSSALPTRKLAPSSKVIVVPKTEYHTIGARLRYPLPRGGIKNELESDAESRSPSTHPSSQALKRPESSEMQAPATALPLKVSIKQERED